MRKGDYHRSAHCFKFQARSADECQKWQAALLQATSNERASKQYITDISTYQTSYYFIHLPPFRVPCGVYLMRAFCVALHRLIVGGRKDRFEDELRPHSERPSGVQIDHYV
jgi:hypothetical protein